MTLRITRRPRTELPTVPGWYLIAEAGVSEPRCEPWREGQARWRYRDSVATIPVDGWDGPWLGPLDDLKGVEA